MPEGDTVWLTAHRLHQALGGRRLTISDFRTPQLATTDLRGLEVTEVVARGKHLLVRLDNQLTVHAHLRMDGSWYITRAGQRARRYAEHHVRVVLGNDEWTATGYRIHDLRVLPRAQEDDVVGHLGPDLLGADWDLEEALRRLGATASVPIGEALLDQRTVAGIGNMYKCEVLFMQRINPWTPVAEVHDLPAVLLRARELLLVNRDHVEQSTTGLTARGRQHWVYERGGAPCLRCGTPIRRAEQGTPPQARATYWCPSCQGPGGASADRRSATPSHPAHGGR